MKKTILSLFGLVALFATTSVNATVRTVSNDPNSPGQYTDLQVAINAASAGDTLLVSGSATAYTNTDGIDNNYFYISKKLVLLGTGYNPYKDFANVVSTLGSYIDLQAGSDGTVIQGFVLNTYININGNFLTNITIKRNNINSTGMNANGNGWLISENWALSPTININGSNMIIQNNLFSYSCYINNQATNSNTLFVNNTLVGLNSSSFTLQLNNALISNNIFYHYNGDPNNTYNLGSGNLVSNNIVYGNLNTNPFNVGAGLPNQGSGNKLGVDPKFTSLVFDGNGYPSFASNFLLQASSPVKTAGTDGKELGVYGGSTPAQNPMRGTPAIPQVNSMLINNVTVAPGGTLSVTLKAKEGN